LTIECLEQNNETEPEETKTKRLKQKTKDRVEEADIMESRGYRFDDLKKIK